MPSNTETGVEIPAIIDCRPQAAYLLGHLRRACSLPATELFARMHELPKRQQPLILCGTPADLQMAEHYLLERGHTVAEKIEWTPALPARLQASGEWETGAQSAQLWQAAPLIQRFVTELMPKHGIIPGKGLDIACGAGRDLVYLSANGWQMTGMDQSLDSLQRVATLAPLHPLTVTTLQADLETGSDPFAGFTDDYFDLITVLRYLHRPLFPYIKRILKPNGIILYQTFMQGSEQTAMGRPRNPNFLLAPGELATIFKDADILLDELEQLDDGRPVSAFVARVH